ncbi:hypothetical protein DPMN_145089 [Dreissena polymorpha]|uniref:Uncharacterized protein n=1 Tax=Dreissena polymorpha TaxID=45954 RepID=A0A9D4IX58_DREPO|nr:hypothetical protein DPMN_145089 [Dreissena polymorpha]
MQRFRFGSHVLAGSVLTPGLPPIFSMEVPPFFVVNLHADIFSTFFLQASMILELLEDKETPVVVDVPFTTNMCDFYLRNRRREASSGDDVVQKLPDQRPVC